MHRSRLFGLFVDVPHTDGDQSVAFWAGALGADPVRLEPDDPYTDLRGALDGPVVMEVQRVDDAPRYHVDIETDNVEAEVARLSKLGASEHVRNEGWVVLRAPGGHLLCVVPVQSGQQTFDAHARRWDS